MSLIKELEKARQSVDADGYEMSIGELINLYKDGDLIISPVYQRLFRWEEWQQTSFIESLLIEIPTPPLFVYQDEKNTWEIIDGLQRTSTILKFTGNLVDEHGEKSPLTVLEGTKLLPSLEGKKWESTEEDGTDGIGGDLQRSIKRTRIRVEILKPSSGHKAKYELFQRLNTGGSPLTEQEVRNCVAIMINPSFQEWLERCRELEGFKNSMQLSPKQLNYQFELELVLRFFAFRNFPYKSKMNVHEYLNEALMDLASDEQFELESEFLIFQTTFSYLSSALGISSFQKWNGTGFSGKFLISSYEIIALGVSNQLEKLGKIDDSDRDQIIRDAVIKLWGKQEFTSNSGMGVSGKSRLAKLLPKVNTLLEF